jgi:hypothetical protein
MPAKSEEKRSIRLVYPVDERGVGAFTITVGKNSSNYTFCEIPCEIGGRGFAVHRMGLGNRYDVRVGKPEDISCECLGFYAHGRCKHVLGLSALIRLGKIPVLQKAHLQKAHLQKANQ